MNTFYIALETNHKLSWKIRDTENDMDSRGGLIAEISKLEREYGEAVVILYWKKLRNGWFRV